MSKVADKKLAQALAAGEPAEAPGAAEAARWLATGEGDLTSLDLTTALSAVEAAAQTRALSRIQSLEDSKNKDLRKAARAALHKLRSAGVEVAAPVVAPARFTLAAEAVEHWSTAWLSPPDEEGYSEIVLFWSDVNMVGFYLCLGGGGQGVREDRTRFYTSGRAQLRNLHKEFVAAPTMREIPLTTGLHLALAAVATYQEQTGRSPQDWDAFIDAIPEGIVNSARLLNPIARLPPEVDRDALSQWDQLERWVGHSLPFKPELLAEHGMELFRLASSALAIAPETREERMQQLERDLGQAALDESTRKAIARQMHSLAIYASAGPGEEALARQAWNYYLALTGGIPGSELPYIYHVAFSLMLDMMRYAQDDHEHSHDHGHSHAHDHD